METILSNLDDTEAVIGALEANLGQFLLGLGRAGGGEERDEIDIQWIIGGSPIDYHNAVFRADLMEDRVDEAIEDVKNAARKYQVDITWHLTPLMRPSNLGARLIQHGFELAATEVGMAIDLADLPINEPLLADLKIEWVRTDDDLQHWAETLALGFGEGWREAEWVRNQYREIGYGEASAWRHYVAKWRGEAVGVSSMLMASGVVGIYFVSTIPSARRQGIGRAITAAPLLDAREMGYRVGVLEASEMGTSVYGALGFGEVCRVGIYTWSVRQS
jgi:GNAT superfamily N-acetyltransferase